MNNNITKHPTLREGRLVSSQSSYIIQNVQFQQKLQEYVKKYQSVIHTQ